VETNLLFGSNPNVILTRQTCGQRSGIAAGSKRRALAFYFFGARGKRRGFSPVAAHATRITPEFTWNFSQNVFFFHFFELVPVPDTQTSKIRVELARLKSSKKRQKQIFGRFLTVNFFLEVSEINF